ncbi:MAG: prepilin-type N-terminal cleavage/methylation domain-containing protein [Syntrophotaleaceae bacterium]
MNSDSRGFTLLEVTIAVAIVGISLTALLGLSNRCLQAQDKLRNVTTATLLAQQEMNRLELEAEDNILSFVDTEGRFEEPFQAFSWTARYEETPLEAVKMVVVSVTWDNEDATRSVDITSFLMER